MVFKKIIFFRPLWLLLLSLELAILPAYGDGKLLQNTTNRNIHSADINEPLIKAFTAKYTAILDGSPVRGSAIRQLSYLPNGQANFSFTARVNLASLLEESQFNWNACTPVPDTYIRSLRVFIRNKKQSLDFDHQKLVVNYQYGKKSGQAKMPGNTFDRISMQLALRCDLIKGNSNGRYTVFDRNKLKTYQFKVLGKETIDTPIGKLETTKVELVRENKDRQTLLWFSNNHNFLLVKLQQNESSSSDLEITISEVNK